MSPKVRSDGYQDESLSGDSGRLTYVRNWKEANLLSEPGKPVHPRSPACNELSGPILVVSLSASVHGIG